MRGAWKAEHVGADLGQEHLDGALADAGDGVQTDDLVLKRAEPLGNLLAELIDQFVESVQMRQLLGQQKALVCLELAPERTLEL